MHVIGFRAGLVFGLSGARARALFFHEKKHVGRARVCVCVCVSMLRYVEIPSFKNPNPKTLNFTPNH